MKIEFDNIIFFTIFRWRFFLLESLIKRFNDINHDNTYFDKEEANENISKKVTISKVKEINNFKIYGKKYPNR